MKTATRRVVFGVFAAIGVVGVVSDLVSPEIGMGAVAREDFEHDVRVQQAHLFDTAVPELLAAAAAQLGEPITSVQYLNMSPRDDSHSVSAMGASGATGFYWFVRGVLQDVPSDPEEGDERGFFAVQDVPIGSLETMADRAVEAAAKELGVDATRLSVFQFALSGEDSDVLLTYFVSSEVVGQDGIVFVAFDQDGHILSVKTS